MQKQAYLFYNSWHCTFIVCDCITRIFYLRTALNPLPSVFIFQLIQSYEMLFLCVYCMYYVDNLVNLLLQVSVLEWVCNSLHVPIVCVLQIFLLVYRIYSLMVVLNDKVEKYIYICFNIQIYIVTWCLPYILFYILLFIYFFVCTKKYKPIPELIPE